MIMAPIVDHQAAVATGHTAVRSSAAAHLKIKKEDEEHPTENDGQLGSSIVALAKDDFAQQHVDDDTRDEHENDHAAAAIFRIGETSNDNASSSLFMDECDNYNNDSVIFTEESMMTSAAADLKHSALMTSFDTMEDIDLSSMLSMTSPNNNHKEQQQEFQHSITTTDSNSSSAAILFSTDEELARQLQAEEDEYARQQRDISRKKSQKLPPRKLKKSWLDDLIGEPFPSEVRRNYAKTGSKQSGNSGLMKAIAAAEARASAAMDSSSILIDKTNTTTSCSKRGSNASSSRSNSSINVVDEGINQLSTSISKWWSSNVAIHPNKNDDNNDDDDSPTTSKEEDLPTFIDNGSEGYYTGDFLTDPTTNNNTNIQPLQRHGQGIMTYKSGHTFTGNFQNNTFHGWGIYLWADGDKQRGTWQHGLRHGPCVFHHAASDTIEYGYYVQGKVVGEGVRVNGDRTKAWKLVDGKRVLEGTIEMEEAERIVAERFECFPIPVAVRRKKKKRFDDGNDEEER